MKVTLDLYVDDLEESLQNSYSLDKLNVLSFKDYVNSKWWNADEIWFNYDNDEYTGKPTKSIRLK